MAREVENLAWSRSDVYSWKAAPMTQAFNSPSGFRHRIPLWHRASGRILTVESCSMKQKKLLWCRPVSDGLSVSCWPGLPATLVVRRLPLLPQPWCSWRVAVPLWSGQIRPSANMPAESLTAALGARMAGRLLPPGSRGLGPFRRAAASMAGGGRLEWRGLRRDHPQRAGPWVLARVPMGLPSLTAGASCSSKIDQFARD